MALQNNKLKSVRKVDQFSHLVTTPVLTFTTSRCPVALPTANCHEIVIVVSIQRFLSYQRLEVRPVFDSERRTHSDRERGMWQTWQQSRQTQRGGGCSLQAEHKKPPISGEEGRLGLRNRIDGEAKHPAVFAQPHVVTGGARLVADFENCLRRSR